MASDRFEPLDPGVWRAKAEGALGDGMTAPDADGIPIQLLYTTADAVPREAPGSGTRVRGNVARPNFPDGWQVRHEYTDPDPSSLARALSTDAAHGVGGAWLRLDPSVKRGSNPGDGIATRRVGCMLDSLPALRDALAEVDPTSHPIYLAAGAAGPPLLAFLLATAEDRKLPIAALKGGVLCDPIATLASLGGVSQPFEVAYISMADVVTVARERAPGLAAIGVSTSVWHDAGASPVQEIGLGVAAGLEYLRALERYAVTPADAAARMIFDVSVGPQPLAEVAKLRALRMLWAGVVSRAGLDPATHGARLHVRGSFRHLARRDPWINMLRGTVAAFAGACGGAEGVAIPAFDQAIGPSDAFGRRMAINTQLILRDESHLHRVVDPAGGSHYLENLTEELASRAWDLVRKLEEAGGLVAALRSGIVQDMVIAQAAATRARVEAGEQAITGVTLHPPESERETAARAVDRTAAVKAAVRRRETVAGGSAEEALRKLAGEMKEGDPARRIDAAVAAARAGAASGDIQAALAGGGGRIVVTPVRPNRLAEPYEGGGT